MFERFSDEARSVMAEAQAEARELRHNYIGTEHLLLGVLRLPGDQVAARVLTSLGVDGARMRDLLRGLVPAGDEPVAGQMPFTPRSKRTLELAMRETLSRGDFHVRPEHILLAIGRGRDGVAIEVLQECGITADDLCQAVEEKLPEPQPTDAESVPRRLVAAARRRSHVARLPIEIDLSAEAHRLMMSAGARALDDGRRLITIADIEEALRGRDAGQPPPQSATG